MPDRNPSSTITSGTTTASSWNHPGAPGYFKPGLSGGYVPAVNPFADMNWTTTSTTPPPSVQTTPPSPKKYKKGGQVKKTGPAYLHKGERVLTAKQNKKYGKKKGRKRVARKR